MKFIECVGNASTPATLGSRRLGRAVSANAYEDGDKIVLKLSNCFNEVKGVSFVTMTHEQYDKFCEKQDKPLFVRGIELFGAQTMWS